MEENKPEIEQSAEEENYSPYCPICDACGEDGCCSAMNCEQHPDGRYCGTYLNELRFGYIMYKKLYDLIDKNDAYKEELDRLWHETWDAIHK